MAAFANGKVVVAERAFSIMTSHATLSASGGVMIERLGLGDLASLWHACTNLMALVTGSLFVFRVTEANSKRLRELRRT
jgi:hypothetical protein